MSIFSKSDSGLTILCDVGSGSMTVSLVLYSKYSQPTFLYTVTKGFTVPDKPDSFKLVDNMLSSLDELILKVVDESSVHSKKTKETNEIQNVVLSFSSPWFLPKTKQIEINEEKPFVITEAYLKKLLNQEEENFKKEIRESSENKEGDFEIIENSIVHVKVNGYVISKIIGQRVSSFSAYFCMSLISKDVWGKIHTIVQKHTHLDKEKIILHTFPVVSFTVLRDMFSDFQDFILMDVTSEVTDLTLVSGDVLIKTTSIPLGRNYIIRQIAKQFGVPSEIAESDLSLYSTQKLIAETSDKIQNILIDIEKEWAE
jgi:cell division ATPase FtsA